MHNLPAALILVLGHCERVFGERVWAWAKVLLIGAILTSGKRTVTATLGVMGLRTEAQFQNYERAARHLRCHMARAFMNRCPLERMQRRSEQLAYTVKLEAVIPPAT